MIRFLLRRLASSAVVLAGVSIITFALARLIPSDVAAIYIGPRARPEQIERVREQLGLNQDLVTQYLVYMRDMLGGDWGSSIATKRPVLDEILLRLPATLELIVAAMLIALPVGLVLGMLSARWQGKPVDVGVRIVSIIGVSLPAFFLGLLLQILFFRTLDVLPLSGRVDSDLRFTSPIDTVTGVFIIDAAVTGNWTALVDVSWHIILPAITLAAYPIGLISRMTRSAMLESLGKDYIRMARAYGLRERLIVSRLALRNALVPVLTVIGLTLAYLLTGTFFVEIVFNWPGLGTFAVRSILATDYPAIMGIALFGAAAYVLINLVVDLAQAWVDPRIPADLMAATYSQMPSVVSERPGFGRRAARAIAHDPLALFGLFIITIVAIAALFGPWLAPAPGSGAGVIDVDQRMLPPSAEYPFGTDWLGRDMLTRVILGARIAVQVSLIVVGLAVLVGVPLGAAAGYVGGWVDGVIMRATDLFLAFPPLLLAMAIVAALGPGLQNATFALVVSWWPWYARIARGLAVSLREWPFVDAARSMGIKDGVIVMRHIIPNSIGPIVVQATIDIGTVILAAGALAFIGLGARPPAPDWGLMVAEGRQFILDQWWLSTFPGLAIFFTVLAFNLVGDLLLRLLDPRQED